MENNKISHTQLMMLTFVSVLSPAIRILPTLEAKYAGGAVTLSLAIGGVLSILYINSLWKLKNAGESIIETIEKGLGKPVSRIICGVLPVWLVFYTGFVLRGAGERIVSSVFRRGRLWSILIPMLIVSAYSAKEGASVVARCGSCVFTVIIPALGVILPMSVGEIDIEYILPVADVKAQGVAMGAFAVFDVMTVFFYGSILRNKVREEMPGRTKRWAIGTLITIAAISIVTVGGISPEAAEKTDHPFFVMIRNISITGVIERMDSVVIALWVLSDFIYIGMLITIAEELWRQNAKEVSEKTRIFGVIMIYAVSLLCGHNQFDYRTLSEKIIPVINTAVVMSIWTISEISGRIYVKHNKGLKI